MEEVVAELRLTEAVGVGVEVVGELPDGAEVSVLGALAETGELEIVEHALTESRGHVVVLWQGVKKAPLRGTMRHERSDCQRRGKEREFRRWGAAKSRRRGSSDRPAALA